MQSHHRYCKGCTFYSKVSWTIQCTPLCLMTFVIASFFPLLRLALAPLLRCLEILTRTLSKRLLETIELLQKEWRRECKVSKGENNWWNMLGKTQISIMFIANTLPQFSLWHLGFNDWKIRASMYWHEGRMEHEDRHFYLVAHNRSKGTREIQHFIV